MARLIPRQVNLTPETYVLQNVPWQLFCTLTFEGEQWTVGRRFKCFHAWVRQLGKSYGIPDRFLLWSGRYELGEVNGRPHFHALLAGLRETRAVKQDVFRAVKLWEGLRAGFAHVRPYDDALDGVDYILKSAKALHSDVSDGLVAGTLNLRRSGAGANAYESRKFDGRASEVLIGPGVWSYVARRRACGVADLRKWNCARSTRQGNV